MQLRRRKIQISSNALWTGGQTAACSPPTKENERSLRVSGWMDGRGGEEGEYAEGSGRVLAGSRDTEREEQLLAPYANEPADCCFLPLMDKTGSLSSCL